MTRPFASHRPCLRAHRLWPALASALLAFWIASPAKAQAPPDTVFLHGQILTGAHLRKGDPSPTPARVEALAVRGGRILAVGSDSAIAALRGPATVVVNLHGAFAMPGFNDAHTHMALAGEQRLAVNLVGTRSLAEMQARIRDYVANAPDGQWILGGGWDHTLWPSGTLPTRADLDRVTGSHPALLVRVDGHIAVVNTAALTAAGITANTADPAGGKIDRDRNGDPTGIVREAPALSLVQSHIPKLDAATRQRALELAIADALQHGVTSVQDFSELEDFAVLEHMETSGQLPLRVAEWTAFETPLPVLEARRAEHAAGDSMLHLTQLKAFMDGSLGSRTAALWQPYSDDPGNSGLPRIAQDRLNALSRERAAAGFQLGFHAIGDRANDMALNAFEAALCPQPQPAQAQVGACHPAADRRFRIEHAQVVSPGAFARFARLRVIASMQPSHLLTDMAWAGARLGPERSTRAYAWRSFLDHGVVLAFGTDYPVESIDPFRGLYAAVTRKNEAGTETFGPEQRLTLPEALYAYTQAPAFAEFREKEKGRLESGFDADFIVLEHDPAAVPPKVLLHTRVLRTVVAGVTRFQAAGPAPAGAAPAGAPPRPAGVR